MLTGVPVKVSIDPAWAANANGRSSCDVDLPRRTAKTTTIGTNAATAPLTLINAVNAATSNMIALTRRTRDSPTFASSFSPAHVVTPVASRASLTTKSAAMNTTVGSPNPASACSIVITPVAYSARAVPIAMMPTGIRPITNSATTSASTTKVMVMSFTIRKGTCSYRTAPSRK